MAEASIGVRIAGLGKSLGENILTNEDLERMVDTSDEWIRTRTGIGTRHIAARQTATSDLAFRAAQQALDSAGVAPSDLDLIIVATVTPDMTFPSVACLLQAGLGAGHAAAFDLSAACSGFLYGLDVGARFIQSGRYEHVLVVGAETLSRITDYTDRRTCVLFGDGAGAAVLEPAPPGKGLLASVLGADGNGKDLMYLPAGGSRRPASMETVQTGLHYIKMNGNEVFKYAVRIMGDVTTQALSGAGLGVADVDLFIPHQANYRIIDATARRLGLPPEKVFVNIERYGNMSAATIPIALREAAEEGRLRDGAIVVLAAFGGGLTWAASVWRW